jgi:carboxyl-terminal processing protease
MYMRTKLVLSLIFAGGIFYGGYTLGLSNYNWESIVAKQVAGTAVPQDIEKADFAPMWKAWAILDQKIAPSKASSTKVVTEQDKVWGAIQGLAASFGDPYTTFFPPQEAKAFAESVKGSFGGVGMEVTMKDKIITVVAPLKGTPAERAGIKANDRIVKIDGTSTVNMSLDKAVSMMHGDPGTIVKLTILRESEHREIELTITRAIIEIPTIETELQDGVFVIHLFSFTENSAVKFRDALLEFGKLYDVGKTNKLVIDLRSNPGGYLESAVDIASFFLPEGKEIVREVGNREYGEKVYRSRGFDVFKDGNLKLAILIDGGSASASEIVASALRDHEKAILVGEKSFGKGSVQELIPITDDTSLKVTIARWLTPKGVSISDGGILPDIVVPHATTTKEGETPKDVQLLRAIEELKK